MCEAEPIQRNVQCFSSECKSDPDCPQSTKCCFDGCGLKCRPIGGEDASETSSKTTSRNGQDSSSTYETSPLQRPTKPHNQPSKKASSESGRKVDIDHKKVGECLPLGGGLRSDCLSGTDECDSDDQCHGVKKCCSDGCFKRCLPPYKATNCIHLKTALEGVPSDSEGGRRVLCRIGLFLCIIVEL